MINMYVIAVKDLHGIVQRTNAAYGRPAAYKIYQEQIAREKTTGTGVCVTLTCHWSNASGAAGKMLLAHHARYDDRKVSDWHCPLTFYQKPDPDCDDCAYGVEAFGDGATACPECSAYGDTGWALLDGDLI